MLLGDGYAHRSGPPAAEVAEASRDSVAVAEGRRMEGLRWQNTGNGVGG